MAITLNNDIEREFWKKVFTSYIRGRTSKMSDYNSVLIESATEIADSAVKEYRER